MDNDQATACDCLLGLRQFIHFNADNFISVRIQSCARLLERDLANDRIADWQAVRRPVARTNLGLLTEGSQGFQTHHADRLPELSEFREFLSEYEQAAIRTLPVRILSLIADDFRC